MTDEGLDIRLFQAINGLAGQSGPADALMLALAHSSTILYPAILLFAYLLWRNRREAVIVAALFGGVFVIGDFFGAQIKHLVARARPCHVAAAVHQLTGCGATFSFPSNHAVNTAAAAAAGQVLYPKSGWVSWPIVALVGFARVFVGAHYVTDVIGGWCIGAAVGAAMALALMQWKGFRAARTS